MSLSREYRNELKVKAAYYFYKKNMTLSDIAKTLDISRVTLNRLLKDAVDEGIVRIEIFDKDNVLRLNELEEAAKERFLLQDVVIVNSFPNDYAFITNEIALAASKFVERKMFSGMKISLTWGRTLELMMNYMKGNSYVKDIEVYTLMGAQDCMDIQMQPHAIAHDLLQKYDGRGFVMNAPYMCETEEACRIIMSDKDISTIVDRSKDSDITLVSIGPMPNETVSHVKRKYDTEIIRELKKYGACGEMGMNFYDIRGNLCRAPICERFVKVGLEDWKQHKCVIGMGGGSKKVSAIVGALNGRYLDVLVTDHDTIVSVMEEMDMLEK